MKVKVYEKDVHLSTTDTERVSEKLSFLDRYLLLGEEANAQVTVKKHGNDIKLEIMVPSKVGLLRSEVVNHTVKDAIDDSVDKLEDQLLKQKTRLSRRHREKLAKAFINEDVQEPQEEKVVRTKRVIVEEMDIDEAILQMELADHDFFAFKDVDTKVVSILYRRHDGDYGILEIV